MKPDRVILDGEVNLKVNQYKENKDKNERLENGEKNKSKQCFFLLKILTLNIQRPCSIIQTQ